MTNKGIVYVEPDDYFPKEIRDKLFPENKEEKNISEDQPTSDDKNKEADTQK